MNQVGHRTFHGLYQVAAEDALAHLGDRRTVRQAEAEASGAQAP